MARQILTTSRPVGPSSTIGVSATITAADATLKEAVLANKRRILIIGRNSGATPRACTVDNGASGGVACTGTIAAGAIKHFGPFSVNWRQRSGVDAGYITFEAAHAEILWTLVDVS